MILTEELKDIIFIRRLTQAKVARAIGITPRTFHNKMKSGIFGTDEVEDMIELLHIEDPARIFFAKKVT